MVFGRTAGIAAAASPEAGRFPLRHTEAPGPGDVELNLQDVRRSLESLMTRSVAVFRQGVELASAMRALGYWREYVLPARSGDVMGYDLPKVCETKNMLVAATLVVSSALEREESRGAHRRLDFPERDDARWGRRIVRSIEDFG